MPPKRFACLVAALSLFSAQAQAQAEEPQGAGPAPKKGAASGETTGKPAPDDSTTKDANPKDADPKDADPKDADPKDANPKDANPKDANPKSEPPAADPKSDANTPAPSPTPAPQQPAPQPFVPPTKARIEFGSNYEGTQLEMRSLVQSEPWARVCVVPCNTSVDVEGREARFTAPGMSTSNTFILEPGTGTARMRVAGGSQVAKTIGLASIIAGIPLALGGSALFAVGEVDDRPTMSTVGIAVGIVGAVAILTAIPLLMVGSTKVRDGRGSTIARSTGFQYPRLF